MAQNNQESNSMLPSNMAQVRTTMKYTLLDYLRSKRFLIMFVITLFLGILLTAVVAYERPQGLLDSPLDFYSGWWSGAIILIIVFAGILFGGDAISNEFQSRTGYFGTPNPVRRSTIYIGKMLGAFIAASGMMATFAVIVIGNGLYYEGLSMPVQFAESVLFSWLYLAAILGFSFFFSSLFKNSALSIITTVIFVLIGFSFIEGIVVGLVKIEPWFILTYAQSIISNVFINPYPVHAVTSFGVTTYTATIPEGLAIIALYFAVTTVLGLVLFERKEFN